MTSPRPRTLRAAALAVGVAVAGLDARRLLRDQPDHHRGRVLVVRRGPLHARRRARHQPPRARPRPRASPARSRAALINEGDEDRSVTLAVGDEETTVELGPKETVLLGGQRRRGGGVRRGDVPRHRRPAGRPGAGHRLDARGRLDRRPGARARRHAARVRRRRCPPHPPRTDARRTEGAVRRSDGPFCVRAGLSRSGPRCSPPWPARAARRRSSPCRRSRPAGPARRSPRG